MDPEAGVGTGKPWFPAEAFAPLNLSFSTCEMGIWPFSPSRPRGVVEYQEGESALCASGAAWKGVPDEATVRVPSAGRAPGLRQGGTWGRRSRHLLHSALSSSGSLFPSSMASQGLDKRRRLQRA